MYGVSLSKTRRHLCKVSCREFLFQLTPRKYVFWDAIQYFAGQRYTLTQLQNFCNFYIVYAASLVDSQKDTKLRAHTVNLAFRLRSFVG